MPGNEERWEVIAISEEETYDFVVEFLKRHIIFLQQHVTIDTLINRCILDNKKLDFLVCIDNNKQPQKEYNPYPKMVSMAVYAETEDVVFINLLAGDRDNILDAKLELLVQYLTGPTGGDEAQQRRMFAMTTQFSLKHAILEELGFVYTEPEEGWEDKLYFGGSVEETPIALEKRETTGFNYEDPYAYYGQETGDNIKRALETAKEIFGWLPKSPLCIATHLEQAVETEEDLSKDDGGWSQAKKILPHVVQRDVTWFSEMIDGKDFLDWMMFRGRKGLGLDKLGDKPFGIELALGGMDLRLFDLHLANEIPSLGIKFVPIGFEDFPGGKKRIVEGDVASPEDDGLKMHYWNPSDLNSRPKFLFYLDSQKRCQILNHQLSAGQQNNSSTICDVILPPPTLEAMLKAGKKAPEQTSYQKIKAEIPSEKEIKVIQDRDQADPIFECGEWGGLSPAFAAITSGIAISQYDSFAKGAFKVCHTPIPGGFNRHLNKSRLEKVKPDLMRCLLSDGTVGIREGSAYFPYTMRYTSGEGDGALELCDPTASEVTGFFVGLPVTSGLEEESVRDLWNSFFESEGGSGLIGTSKTRLNEYPQESGPNRLASNLNL